MSPLLDRAFTGRGFRIRLHVAPGWIVFVDVDAGSSHEGSPAVAPVPGFACRFLHPDRSRWQAYALVTASQCRGGMHYAVGSTSLRWTVVAGGRGALSSTTSAFPIESNRLV